MDILALTTDLMDRSVIQQVLQHSGHQVTFVRSEEDVWRHVDEGAFRFVILDEEQNEQGFQPLIEKIRAASASLGWVYVILLVSKSHNGDLVANLGLGADDYIVKPIAPQEIKARVSVGARFVSMGDELLAARIQIERLVHLGINEALE